MYMEFAIRNNEFYVNGQPFQIRSGAIHYFRVPRAYWYDRLLKLKECGFNTVETYVAWNLHEPKEGTYDFSEEKDLGAFIATAQKLGLYAIVRPGPFICAEWEAGGFPAWLLKDRNMRLRCNYEPYMQKVSAWLKRLFAEIKPHLAENGGNILLLQVENEYGSYGNDKAYLRKLYGLYRENGMNGLLCTADGACANMLGRGALGGCLTSLTFGSHTRDAFAELDAFRAATKDGEKDPKLCMEFWCGWFDHWGSEHCVREADDVIKDIEPFMQNGWSFNLYMFHGGTNFAFYAGANTDENERYLPDTTSYDYGAPLSEAGDRTELYYKLRDLMGKYNVFLPPVTATDSEKAVYGNVLLIERVDLLQCLPAPIETSYPITMEEAGQGYGFILYQTVLPKGYTQDRLYIDGVADRAVVYVDGVRTAVFDRNVAPPTVMLDSSERERTLQILVENRGRVNYGKNIYDRKGLSAVRHGMATLFDWKIYPLPFDVLPKKFNVYDTATDRPCFLRGTLQVAHVADTFASVKGIPRGVLWVNGRNLGRFNNEEPPQATLYVPGAYLRDGENEWTVFAQDGAQSACKIEFSDTPVYTRIQQ